MNGVLQDLLARLEAAKGADRELDRDLAIATTPGARVWKDFTSGGYLIGEHRMHVAEHYTASLDATLALVERVLPGTQWQVNRKGDGSAFAAIETNEPGNRFLRVDAKTPAIALLCALVKALIADVGGQEPSTKGNA